MFEQQLRFQAAAFSVELFGRKRSAGALDEAFHRLVDVLEPALFIEAGAFDARASIGVASRHPECHVVAYEASERNFADITAQGISEKGVDYRHAAVGERAGQVSFWENQTDAVGLRGANSVGRSLDPSLARIETSVSMVRLDDEFEPSHQGGVALWVDVEGFALEVFRGSKKLLHSVDLIKVEVEDRESWAGQALAVDVISFLLDSGLIPVFRDAEYEDQYNVVFISERFLSTGKPQHVIEDFFRTSQHALHGDPSSLRTNPRLRALARPVRAAANSGLQRLRRQGHIT